MKIKVILLGLVSSLMITGAVAQGVENDDMYFNSKDRAKLRAQREAEQQTALASARKVKKSDDELNNPTDSYSARNVNPEYTSRSQSRTAREDEANYFVNNYRYNNYSAYNNWNNNFRSWYGNPWYGANYYSPYISRWNSPYYGYYDSFNSPWNDPYWSYNGYSSSFSYYYGGTYNYGWGGNYNYWNRPYCPSSYYNNYSSYYSGYSPYYGSNWYWNNYRYGNTVVIVNNSDGGRGVSYGKRPTRGSTVVGNTDNRSRSSMSTYNGDTGNSGGRVSTSGRTEYYNRTWRNSPTNNTSYDSRTNTQQNRSSSWSTPSNSNYSNNSTTSPSRSSTPTYNSGGSRSTSSSGSTGGGSNGRSRGRD